MAIEKKLIHFSKLSDFETQLNAGNILDYSIVFIQDAKKIWTHGQYYDCNGGDGASDSPTFLRIGDADDEAKANFMAVAKGEKSADYYICSSKIQDGTVNGISTKLNTAGPTGSPVYVSYTFYGSPMSGGLTGKLLKITTNLTVSTGVITTEYEAVLDAKQDTITDLETIREGAAKGATSVQPNDISTVATSGSYEDLTDKPVYITTFDVSSLRELALDPIVVGGIQSDNRQLSEALATNKIVLVPYAKDDGSVRGYATLVGYTEDLVYFKVITDIDEIIVETSLEQDDIYGQEVTLRQWSDKQDKLISGTNIKTINGNSILGGGDINMPYYEGSGYTYVQKGISDDSLLYAFPTSADGDEDDVIATRLTLKTINGESLLGSGDITISGGGGSSAYSEVSHGTADTTFTLTPNTFHIWDEVSSLTLTLGAETSGVANEYLFQFTSGSTATTLSLPDDIKWTGGEAPTIEANKIYQVSILKGLGSVLEWDNAPTLIENNATLSVGTSNYTVTFEHPVASDLSIKVSTSDGNINNTISSGMSSVTLNSMGPLTEPSAYILQILPSADDTYIYTF